MTAFVCSTARRAVLVGVLVSVLAATVAPVEAHGACNRVGVETRDGHIVVSSYVVSEFDWVNRMHRLIDQNGDSNGSWTVSAGDLGLAGYTVTYSCQPLV